MKTMGGRQFWGDVAFFRGWRIQHNIVFDHYRLLDPEDNRHASGTLEECQQKLSEIKQEQQLPPMTGKAVIMIHGIIRSSKSFTSLGEIFEKEGYTVVNFDYPSTQAKIPDHAEYLNQVIKSLEGIEEIHLVVHSMGGLIVRAYVDQEKENRDARLKRLVMLGVPNFGAEIADFLQNFPPFRMIFGESGQQLVTGQEDLIANLPVPDFDFAVIAGGLGNEIGFNPILPGDNDGIVTTASTRLPGAKDYVVVNCMHSFMPFDKTCGEYALRYIKTGCLHEDGVCVPVLKDDEEENETPQ